MTNQEYIDTCNEAIVVLNEIIADAQTLPNEVPPTSDQSFIRRLRDAINRILTANE